MTCPANNIYHNKGKRIMISCNEKHSLEFCKNKHIHLSEVYRMVNAYPIMAFIISMVLFRPQSSVLFRHKLFATEHHVSLNISTTSIDATDVVSIHDCVVRCTLNSVCCVASLCSNS